jgi:YVTN family beta-propeller protein
MLKRIVILVAILLAYLPSASAQALGTINTVAGGGPNNLPALQVGLGYPFAVVKDTAGNVYVGVESAGGDGGRVYKIATNGTLTIVAGNGAYFYEIASNNGDGGPAIDATLGPVGGLAIDSQQNLYIADDEYNSIRKVNALTGVISTVAGGATSVCATATDVLGDGCPATMAIFDGPSQVYVDANLNIFIADSGYERIREVVAATGLMQTVAGGATTVCENSTDTVGDGCAATSAILGGPAGVFTDSSNNIYIADTANNRVREVNASTGIIQTIAGTGTAGFSGDGAAATTAQVSDPRGLFLDSFGNVYFSDYSNSRIREIIVESGEILTIAGGGGILGCGGESDIYGDNCPATEAYLPEPFSVFVDPAFNLYIADYGTFTVREVAASNDVIQAVAGNGTPSFSGDGQIATNAELDFPYGMAVDPVGDIYIADFENERIRRVDAITHIIQTVAGSGTTGTGCPGETDAFGDGCLATQALIYPFTVFVDAHGNIYFTDYGLGLIRRVDGVTGIITSVAGGGSGCPNQTDTVGDGCPASDATLADPWGIYVDPNANIFFADYGNSRVREVVASTGLIQTIAGTGVAGYNGNNIPAVQAQVYYPIGVYGDAAGNLYFSDLGNYRIRKIVASTGNIVTVAGTGTPGYNGDNIAATTAEIFDVYGIYVDQAANLFFGDYVNGRVREIVASTGLIQTVAGDSVIGFSGDGGPATSAMLSFVADVGGDFAGNLYIADTYNNRVREVYGIVPANTLVVTTQSLPPGVVGTPYSFGVQAAGGALPYSWTLISGSLPPGFSPLSSAGVLSGTATAASTYNFTVQVTDAGGHMATQALSLTINPTTTVILETIVVTPVDPTLLEGAILPFIATGIYSDGSEQNLTGTVTWTSGTTTVATINSSGVATGVGAGPSTITARLGNVFGSTTLTVTATHPYAYIGSVVSANCCLDVLDTTTNSVVGTIPLTGFGEPFGITPDQTRLYIADYTDNLVNVVDTSSNTLLTTIPVGQGPNAVAITPNGQYGYVANAIDTTVSVFSVATNTMVTTISTGISAANVTVTPDGKSVYVAGVGNTIAVISTSTNTVTSTFQVSVPEGQQGNCCLFGPLLNPSGTLGYVMQNFSTTSPGSVSVISLPSNTTVASIPLGIAPYDSAITPDGTQLYVVNANSNTVSVIDTATNTVVATIPVGNSPQSIAITPDGTLAYVANTVGGSLSIIQTSTNKVLNTIPLTTPFGILIPSPPVPSQAPVLTLNPLNLIFNGQPLGLTSGPQTINVSNPGAAALTLTSIGLTGPGATSFSLNNGCPAPPATLGPGANCNVQVSFAPLTASTLTALVSFNFTNGEVASQQSAPLSGTGVTSAATVLPTSLAFGNQTVSTTSPPQAITISSNGTGPFVISSIVVTGTNPGDFPMATNCPIGGAGLATGTSCGIFISFAPTDLGARSASVVVTDNQGNVNGSQQTVTLTGTGADVPVAASTTYNFTGNPFTFFSGAVTCPPDCNISGFFTLAQPLGPNLTNVGISPTSYSANVGTTTFTPANTSSGRFASISTDASGNIIAWSISLSTSAASFSTVNLPTGSADTFTQVSPQGTASNAGSPSTWPTTTVTPLSFPVSTTPVSNVATLNCPSGTVPCTDPNAHSFKLTVPAVSSAFTLTVTAFEVPPSQATGDCLAGQTEATNFPCRFVTYFNLGSDGHGGTLVPQCIPYADGNCVFYRVSNTPPDGSYTQGISEFIAWNNTSFTPSSFYNASNPQLYDDPDSPPYDVNHQFVFDITQYFVPGGNQVGVDPGISGSTKKFNDFVVAYPQAPTSPYTATVLSPLGNPTVTSGATVPVAFTLQQSGSYTGNALVAPNVVSIGVVNSSGVRQPTIDPTTGVAAVFVYNSSANPPQYQLNLSTQGYAAGTYQLFINSNLFPQLVESFTVTQTAPLVPGITINPTSLSFANQVVSTTSAQMVINVSSSGTAALLISSIAVTGTNPSDFPMTTNCPIGGDGLAVNASCGIFVSFAPTDLGARSASVVVTDNNGNVSGSQQSVPLSGTGVDVPTVPSTTYNITGNPFTTFTGSAACPPDCNITGSFTLSQPLAPNLSLATITPSSFSFSVGPYVLNQSNAAATFDDVSTDASGNITGWDITLANTNLSIITSNVNEVASDSFQISSPQGTASNSGSPATWPTTTVTPLTFQASTTPVSNVATLNCPSGTVPCTDPNAHSFKLTVPAVSSAFTLTVTAFEVPPSQATGDCLAGQTEATNFPCRFVTYFNLGSDGHGGTLVPQCIPYADGNCVFYRVSNTPPDGSYTQGISEFIAWNNTSFTPSSFYNASNPQLYDDPDSPPYDINHQFVFDITQYFVSGGNQVGVDPGISGSTKKFNDFVVAYPQAPTNPYTATVLTPVDNPSTAAGTALPVAFTLQQSGSYTGNALVAPNVVSIGVVNSSGARQPTLDPTGAPAAFVYNSSANPPQYQLNLSTQGYAAGTYQLFINSNLFPQLTETFTVAASGPFVTFGLASQNPYSIATGSGGSYIVTVNFVNRGNVTVNSCTVTGGTLGSASMTSFTGGPCTNVLPGQGFTFNVTFPSSAGAAGAGVPLQLKGTYTAGTLNGNWSQTFRKVVLP